MGRVLKFRAGRFGTSAMAVALVTMTGLSVVAQSTPALASPSIILVAPIDLGRAAPFAVLAGASIGNTATGPITIVRGDMGVFAGTGAVTGFPPGLVRGTQYASGATAVVDAHTDLLAAYAAAANRPSNFALAPDLVGLTLSPGVHTYVGAVANTGTVTLDGGDNPDSVFIFQIGAAFSAAALSHVVLTHGTQAKNVFWQVNGAGAIGANSDFAGTMMTAAAIGVGADSLFNGRALAETGAITTNSNQFYSGPPAITITGAATVFVADSTPTISGTTTVDTPATVTVTIGAQTLQGTVDSGGAWTATAAGLANNTYAVTAVATDVVGNIGTATQSLTVDITPPVVTINGGPVRVTNDPTPTIDGTTDVGAGSLVTVTFNGQPMTTLVQPNGTWNLTSSALAGGSVTVVATVHDLAANPGTATQILGIDLTAPVVTISGGATALTNNTTPTLTGTATGATATTVSIDGQDLPGASQVGSGWTAAFPAARAPLSNGSHYIIVTSTDVAGNTTVVTQTLTVDASLPTIAIIPGAVDATNDQTPTISGTTDVAAGSIVSVTINGGATMSASVQANGTWNTTPSSSLAAGVYAVVATVGDTAGNIGTATQSLTVDVTAPTVTITGGASRTTADATPTIAGSSVGAAVGTAVTVSVAAQTLSTTVGAGGAWTTTAATIANGSHAVTVMITDAAGNTGSAAQSLTISAIAPIVTITGGATASTNDSTPMIAGTSTSTTGSAVVVSVSGQVLNSTVQPGGSWNVTASAIANAAVVVSVVVTDLDGNVGLATQTLTVDSTNATLISISGGAARSTNDDTPTISGTTDAADGRVVTVVVGGQTMTTPAFLGTWSVTATHLADGLYAVNASVAAPGNPGASAPQALTIDTVVPVVVLPGGGTIDTTDPTPTIGGSGAPPGATVTVTVAGQTLTTTVAADGTWSVTPLIPLPPGPHTVVVTITDLAGNQGIGVQVITVLTPPIILPPGAPTPDYTSVGPRRVFDTRAGQSLDSLRVVAKQQVSGRYELQVQMTGLAGFVPSTGVGAVSLNVTSTGSTADGFITVYGCGTRELVSSVNFPAGRTVANAVVAPVSASGMVCFYANTPTDIVVDLNGWFATGAAFTSVGPKRVFDTRPGNSPDALRTMPKAQIPANGIIEVQLTDLDGYVPTSGVNSVSLNVVVTNPDASGFITVYSCGPRALVSNVNYVAGQTVANAVIAPVSASGTVCFYSLADVDLVVDINGWFAAGSDFTGVAPARVLDTRAGNSPNVLRDVPKTKIGGNNVLEVRVTDLTGIVPADGVVAVSLNVTATNPDGDGFVTVFACGAMEQVSSLNFTLGTTVANAVLAPVSASGTICLYSNVSTDVIVDLNGWLGTGQSG